MSGELKPCPFCGSRPTGVAMNKKTDAWWISCTHCAAEMDGGSRDLVMAAWNTRSQPKPVPREGEWQAPERCEACGMHSFTRVDEPAPGGGFRPGLWARCDNCKAETDTRRHSSVPREGEWVMALEQMQETVLASKGTKEDADRRIALKRLQKALAAAPPHDGRGEVEALRGLNNVLSEKLERRTQRLETAEAQLAEAKGEIERLQGQELFWKGTAQTNAVWVDRKQAQVATLTAQLSALVEGLHWMVDDPGRWVSVAALVNYGNALLRSNTKQEGKALLEETK